MDDSKEQFSQIYDQYIEKIYRFVYLKVNSQEIAEDITSDVFTKGWKSFQDQNKSNGIHPVKSAPQSGAVSREAGQFNRIKNPGAFLYQIARNSIVDYYRQKARTNVVSVDNVPQIIDPGTSAHDKAVLSADINAVKDSIYKLKKDYQDILISHYLEDMPVAKIAEIMQKRQGTVRVMLHRGLKDLKGLIKES
jgi:RNA polymerase sigma-70 factor (ECF subfamily)